MIDPNDDIRPRPKAGRLPLYAAAWLMLAGLSLTYLIVVALKPELAAELLGSPPDNRVGVTNGAQRDRMAAEIGALKQSVAQVQLDVAKVKTDLAGHAEQERLIVGRLSALEKGAAAVAEAARRPAAAQVELPTVSLPAAADAVAPQVNVVNAKPVTAQAPATASTKSSAPAVQPAQAAADKAAAAAAATAKGSTGLVGASPIETGSISAPALVAPVGAQPTAPGFGPAVVKAAVPPQPPVAVQIANGPSLDALRLSWSLLADRHSGALGKLEPRYTGGGAKPDGSEESFDLLAGPIANPAEAKRICRTLQSRGVPCKVGPFGGNAL